MSATLSDVTPSEHPAPQLSQRELRNDSGRVLRLISEGQSFILTNSGVPVARISPIDTPTPTLRVVRPAKRTGGWSDLKIQRKAPQRPMSAVLDELREDRV